MVKKFEEYLAPWEVDDEGNALDEPADLDPEKLKKYLHNLLSDKDKLQERVEDVEAERDQAKESLVEMQREKETEAERREREDKEREERFAAAERRERERDKLDFLAEHFAESGITAARAKRLAARVTGDDERAWKASAEELVEDGFRLSDKKVDEREVEKVVDDEPRLQTRPRRSDGTPVRERATGKPVSVADELDAAGIGRRGW